MTCLASLARCWACDPARELCSALPRPGLCGQQREATSEAGYAGRKKVAGQWREVGA